MIRKWTSIVLLIAVLAATLFVTAAADQPIATSSLRITSPLGRTGTVTRIRIVAQIETRPGVELSPVDFFVDGEKAGTVEAGPPWAVDWIDDNPLLRREIVVQATDSTGAVLRDEVVLPSWEVADETEVTGVLLETSVFDKDGRYVSNLTADAFTITEDDAPQTIDIVTKETVPTDLVILVDNSQSMASRMGFVRRAVERLVERLRAKDRAIVVPFNTHIGAVTGPTDDKPTIAQAISAMRAGGGTALLDSIREGAALLTRAEGRRAVVLITDGFDENSQSTLDDVARAIDEVGATTYAVGIGGSAGISLRGQDMLRRIVERTGGKAFFPPQDRDLVLAVSAITTESQSRYLITYTPNNQKKDGRWRSVKVGAPEGYRVRTRAGYYAPAPPPIRPTFEFTVLDPTRRYADVTMTDLEIYEDGNAQAITTFQEAVDPVSMVLAIDSSGSMRRDADLVRSTAKEFVQAVRAEDSLALITFADAPKFAHVLSLNRKWTIDAIDSYTPSGGTALYDALWNALQHLRGVAGRNAIVVLTDGRDENNPGTAPGSLHTLDEVMALQKQVGAAIFAVSLGGNADTAVMNRLAEASGGQTYLASSADALGGEFKRIIEDLRRRYIVGYTSSNSAHDGAWRTIEIRPKQPGYTVLSASGYFAPEK